MARLLQRLRAGDAGAFDELFGHLYERLHAVAHGQRRRWSGDETLDTTALLHEAYLRLARQAAPRWRSRSHFLAVVSMAMRQILLDYAKRKRATKRGAASVHVSLASVETTLREPTDPTSMAADAVIALDESLRRLELAEPRQARIVECRFFGGMTIEETAEALEISTATVKRGWAMAQAWLYRDMERSLDGAAR